MMWRKEGDESESRHRARSLSPPLSVSLSRALSLSSSARARSLAQVDSLNFEEQLKQIDICALGPLRVTSALFNAGLLNDGSKAVIITSQAGSAQWRFTQNPEGGDYGHHMSRAACNIAGVLLSQVSRRAPDLARALARALSRTTRSRARDGARARFFLLARAVLGVVARPFLLLPFSPPPITSPRSSPPRARRLRWPGAPTVGAPRVTAAPGEG